MHFNPEINLGTVIETCTFVLLAIGAARKLGVLESKLNIMFSWFQTEIINGHRHASDRVVESEEFHRRRGL